MRTGNEAAPDAPAMRGDADACMSPVSTSTPKRTAWAVLRESRTWNGISATCLLARSTRRIFPPAHNTIDFESGIHAIPG
jgi:hypothetical protein